MAGFTGARTLLPDSFSFRKNQYLSSILLQKENRQGFLVENYFCTVNYCYGKATLLTSMLLRYRFLSVVMFFYK